MHYVYALGNKNYVHTEQQQQQKQKIRSHTPFDYNTVPHVFERSRTPNPTNPQTIGIELW